MLSQQLSPGLDVLAKSLLDASLKVELPDPGAVDLPPEDLASLVARTANAYMRASRLAGMCRAEAKISKGRFERKYKQNRQGKNDFEREAFAMGEAADEHEAWTQAEAVAEVADGVEAAARVASESARKLLDRLQDWRFADARVQRASEVI